MTEQDRNRNTEPKKAPKKWILASILIITILSFAFYWFEVRPSQIKRECFTEVDKERSLKFMYSKDDFEFYYRNCLREKGL